MRVRFATFAATLGMATAGLLAAGVQSGYASVVATTGGPTSVTSTSAILNGVALTLNPTSAWVFQYGASSSYGQYSHGASVSVGLTAVSETVSNLTPNTTYHFRLTVIQGDPGSAYDYSTGDDVTFTTAPSAPTYGTTSVGTHRLAVSRGVASIPFRCSGSHGSLCKGTVALVARTRRGRLVDCGSGLLAARGGQRNSIASRLNRPCVTLLNGSRSHTVHGAVWVTLAGSQKLLTSAVTLVGSVVASAPRARVTQAHAQRHTRARHLRSHRHHTHHHPQRRARR